MVNRIFYISYFHTIHACEELIQISDTIGSIITFNFDCLLVTGCKNVCIFVTLFIVFDVERTSI